MPGVYFPPHRRLPPRFVSSLVQPLSEDRRQGNHLTLSAWNTLMDTTLATDILHRVIRLAKAQGADAADAMIAHGEGLSVGVQRQKLETMQRHQGKDLDIRIIIGKQQAMGSTSDFSPDSVDRMVLQTVAMARHVPADPYCGIADPDQILDHTSSHRPDLDLFDATVPSENDLQALALDTEQAALDQSGITDTEGASASWGIAAGTLMISNGFVGHFRHSNWGLSVAAVAGNAAEGNNRQVDYESSATSHKEDLLSPQKIGYQAARRALQRLNPKKISTGRTAIMLDPRVGTQILSTLAQAINGQSVARKTSFLKDALETQVFHPSITVMDDPFLPRGPRSRPFDGEGFLPQQRRIIDQGVLTGWIVDLATARQLGLGTTGNAVRSLGSPPRPSVSNFYIQPGSASPEQLQSQLSDGFYVTELMGHGINSITGDLSLGASGIWIEKGQFTHAVGEVTVAGNFKEIFQHLTPANDLTHRYGIDVPTLLIDHMMVAGK